jgi:Flp pilus assembly protein TadD
MPHGSFAAGVRLVVHVSFLLIATPPLWAQVVGFNFFPTLPTSPSAASQIISADLLRNPLAPKLRAKLEKAIRPAQMGDHEQAIENLQVVLADHPKSAPYVHNLLGIEYASTHQVAHAVTAFEETLRWMPHLSANHFNLGLTLLDSGQVDRGEQELRKAVELDPSSLKAQQALEALQAQRRSGR